MQGIWGLPGSPWGKKQGVWEVLGALGEGSGGLGAPGELKEGIIGSLRGLRKDQGGGGSEEEGSEVWGAQGFRESQGASGGPEASHLISLLMASSCSCSMKARVCTSVCPLGESRSAEPKRGSCSSSSEPSRAPSKDGWARGPPCCARSHSCTWGCAETIHNVSETEL